MPLITFQKDGQTWYTHSSWLSTTQKRAYYSVAPENNKLSIYYALSALTLSAIVLK